MVENQNDHQVASAEYLHPVEDALGLHIKGHGQAQFRSDDVYENATIDQYSSLDQTTRDSPQDTTGDQYISLDQATRH